MTIQIPTGDFVGVPCNTRNHAKPLCNCWGRTDHDRLPARCCARRAAETKEHQPT